MTIFALSSAPGKGGIAVIRVSGPAALKSLEDLSGIKNPTPRFAYFAALFDENRAENDRGLVLYFKGPASFTGEDVVEYHVHGGRAVVAGLLEALSRQRGLRLAEPGEFTRRAFENGKIDLTEAEAVADLIDAQTQLQKQQALSQLSGELSGVYSSWAQRLTRVLAHLEADIDFPEETEIKTQEKALKTLLDEVRAHLDDNRRGERLREGFQIAIIGPPNAGKSSLMNLLAQRDVAIVSEKAGTTRDVIEVQLDLGGWPVVIADTAGLREALSDDIEAEGIARAKKRAAEADLKLVLLDATQAPDREILSLIDDNCVIAFNKCDIKENPILQGFLPIEISVKTGAGLPVLLREITKHIEKNFGMSGGPPLTRERHRFALQNCVECLERSLNAPQIELAAEDVRLALRALGRITGRVDVEDLLDIIFRDFCIGK